VDSCSKACLCLALTVPIAKNDRHVLVLRDMLQVSRTYSDGLWYVGDDRTTADVPEQVRNKSSASLQADYTANMSFQEQSEVI
jgi:hypothetical protein